MALRVMRICGKCLHDCRAYRAIKSYRRCYLGTCRGYRVWLIEGLQTINRTDIEILVNTKLRSTLSNSPVVSHAVDNHSNFANSATVRKDRTMQLAAAAINNSTGNH
jgi:hypothetical protein